MIVASKMMLQYAHPVDKVTKIAMQIAKGNYLVRAQTEKPEYDNELAIAIK